MERSRLAEKLDLLQTQLTKALRDRDSAHTELDLLREKVDKNAALIQKLQVRRHRHFKC